jgi:hypothetical protein
LHLKTQSDYVEQNSVEGSDNNVRNALYGIVRSFMGVSWTGVSWTDGSGTLQRLSCHFYLSPFGLEVKNFHRPTGCIHITKDIDKMARMGDIASAASD